MSFCRQVSGSPACSDAMISVLARIKATGSVFKSVRRPIGAGESTGGLSSPPRGNFGYSSRSPAGGEPHRGLAPSLPASHSPRRPWSPASAYRNGADIGASASDRLCTRSDATAETSTMPTIARPSFELRRTCLDLHRPHVVARKMVANADHSVPFSPAAFAPARTRTKARFEPWAIFHASVVEHPVERLDLDARTDRPWYKGRCRQWLWRHRRWLH